MNLQKYLLRFEILFRDIRRNFKVIDNGCLSHLKCKIKDVGLLSFRLYNKKDHILQNLRKDEYTAFLSLKSNNNIIIQKGDKGNTAVILNWVSYVFEIEKLLRDKVNS